MLDYVTAPFLILAGSLALSPGPLNLISLMFGASRNTTRAAPFVLGGAAGFGLVWGVAATLADLMVNVDPSAFEALKLVILCYFMWLAYGILRARAPMVGGCEERQPGPFAGVLVAILNPQTWITALLISSLFIPQPASPMIGAAFGASYAAIVLVAAVLWVIMGTLFRTALCKPKVFGVFRYSSAGILMLLGARLI